MSSTIDVWSDEECDLYNSDVEEESCNNIDDLDESCPEYDEFATSKEEQNYAVLSEEDILNRQEEDIKSLCTVLSVPNVWASILLRHYNWSVTAVHESWFSNEEEVRNKVGFLEMPKIQYPPGFITCGICYDDFPRWKMFSAYCGHLFCRSCYKGYVRTSINDGPGCLTLRCPDPGCIVAITQDMVNNMFSGEQNEKRYSRFLLRSYVEASKKIKWCPAPGCECAAEFERGNENETYDVSCKCTYKFCWNCTEETHRPVDCDTVAKWVLKNSSESENTEWLLANSKPCPKCKRPIEKNNGCMHMTCSEPCRYQFCWLCLGDWSQHGENTGGFYACNTFKEAKEEGLYKEEEKRVLKARRALKLYTHYYERWAANEVSKQKAIADYKKMVTPKSLAKLREKQCGTLSLDFITEAWTQIIECRRVLKWSYAYGFYAAKTELFAFSQGEAESWLERLHQCAEEELKKYINSDEFSEDFDGFRSKLISLTSATAKYFGNLVRELEKGLTAVEPESSRSLKRKRKGEEKRSSRSARARYEYDDEYDYDYDDEYDNEDEMLDPWSCDYCSYVNEPSADRCDMCNEQSGAWTCEECTYSNSGFVTHCRMCDNAR
ncbi:RBR-type E3 ubiquitin transferase [Ranunculus cassubicifolius]